MSKKTGKEVYRAAPGAPFSDADAQAIGVRLKQLREANGGALTPEIFVADARDKTSPLHRHIEWNRTAGLRQYQLHQASVIISKVRVVISEQLVLRQHVHVRIKSEEAPQRPVYVSVQEAKQDEHLSGQVIKRLCSQLRSIRQSLADYSDYFGVVIEAIDTVVASD